MSDMYTKDEQTGEKSARSGRGLKEAGMEVLGDAKSKVSEAVSGVAAQAGEHLAHTRDQIADQGDRMAESLRKASSHANGNGIQTRVLDTMANGLSSMTDMLRNADGSAMVSRVQRFAQRNPLLFATGAAVAGLVIARALASGARHDSDDDFHGSGSYNDAGRSSTIGAGRMAGAGSTSATAPGSLP